MKYKGITIIAGSEDTKSAVLEQLREYIEDDIPLKAFAIDTRLEPIPCEDLIILTSSVLEQELAELDCQLNKDNMISANRTIGYDLIDQLFLIPENSDVLFVNDVKDSTLTGIQQLQNLGINNLNFIPYYPSMKGALKKVNIAITTGETDKVPPFVETVYNIGSRILDFTTITKILTKLEILDEKAGLFSEKYLRKIINIGKKVAEYSNRIRDLNQNLTSVMDGLSAGLLYYETNGSILVCNEKLRKLLRIQQPQIIGKNMRNVLYNKSLLEFLLDPESEDSTILNIYQESLLIRKIVPSHNMILAVFKSTRSTFDETQKIRSELVKKGFFAKYNLEDIKGSSLPIQKVKKIASRLAVTDLNLLIEGESGTGKELLASAIHNLSSRNTGPFIPVNFSALPDELVESELFGYEKGAFTGAKKEGHVGIFEQADGGTIFLDEIGDISLKVQTKILRILQEKEFMRVGGNQIKKVDVRVIAATNKDLNDLIRQKKFREDLYYRLKVGFIHLPPLRKRKEDIMEIVEHLIKLDSNEPLQVSDKLRDKLIFYNWPGNIRELENTLLYILAMRESNLLKVTDLPEKEYFSNNPSNLNRQENALILSQEEYALLQLIFDLQKQGITVGREILSEKSSDIGLSLTPTQVRTRLKKFQELQLVNQRRGKHGTLLTVCGESLLNKHNT